MAIRKKVEPEVQLRRVPPETRVAVGGTIAGTMGFEEASTADIVRRAIEETKELVRIEVEIAKNEAQIEIAQAKNAAIGFSIALAAAVLVLCMLSVAIVLALGGTAGAALVVAAVYLVIGGVAAWLGYAVFPKKPFERVRNRLETDVKQLKEHVA